ncbi:AraC family transcriptional regulator [Pseudonocardia sp. HH130630-07]|uniref:AraC family transcriptional regulator n=1 Tax=Pseudonocardia sp. HH130630-07 TaxID=1690815 RepID=UPI000814BB79|nr:helix-turn-helix domain-containing protein [Pseudonocardia sp. HH130630-07]ANY06876.1 hypothetical protein AFB00_11890 [Pseudonocardia sp. HH130630-07]
MGRGTSGLSATRTDRAEIRVGPGWAAYAGPSLELGYHRGAVACLAIGIDAPLSVDVEGLPAAGPARTVLVPAGLRHRIRSGAGRSAFLYLDPATAAHGTCRDRMTDAHPVLPRRHVAEAEIVDRAAERDLPGSYRAAAGPMTGDPARIDARIGAALRVIGRPGGADVATEVLAAGAELSPPRFRRLFAEQAGIGIRAYRRWARMIVVARVVAAGGDLTRAAADAGFATPSHLSLAFRQMFGLRPSLVLDAGGIVTDG